MKDELAGIGQLLQARAQLATVSDHADMVEKHMVEGCIIKLNAMKLASPAELMELYRPDWK